MWTVQNEQIMQTVRFEPPEQIPNKLKYCEYVTKTLDTLTQYIQWFMQDFVELIFLQFSYCGILSTFYVVGFCPVGFCLVGFCP